MKRWNRLWQLATLLLALMGLQSCAAQNTPESPLILTSLAPIYQLTAPLLAETSVELQLLPGSPRSMQSHKTLFVRQAERYDESFKRADAVISISAVWPEDPLFISTRSANIRVVNIDASKPFSHELSGVAVASAPHSEGLSPYFWLSPANIIRMTDIISQDLQRLYPNLAEQIRRNSEAEKHWWRQFKTRAEQQLLDVADPLVYSLTGDFVYLTSDLAIFVDDYFIKQDLDWSDADLTALQNNLKNHQVNVVIHKWEPAAAIQQSIRKAGARLVILDNLETTENFKAGMQNNLNRLLEAFPRL